MKEQLRILAGAHPMSPQGFERVQGLRRVVYDSADYREGSVPSRRSAGPCSRASDRLAAPLAETLCASRRRKLAARHPGGGRVGLGQRSGALAATEPRRGWRVALAPGAGGPMTLTLLPATATRDARLLLLARGLRAVRDGFVSIILPAYLLLQGFDALQVGALATATLLGSALLTLAVGAHRATASPARAAAARPRAC